jgi:hypothetical protein
MTEHPLWLYWGGNHLTYLRWATIATAARFHDHVILVRRPERASVHVPAVDAAQHWHEHQDFQRPLEGKNWIGEIPKSVELVTLEEVAPQIAELEAPDVQTSDLLAWHLLATRGGTVADMDVVFIDRLPEVTHPIQMVVCTGWPLAGYMPIGFLQGEPCDFWRAMYRRAREAYNPKVYQSCGAERFPPWAEIPEPKRLLPEHVVYPFALKAEWMRWHDWMFELT